MEIRPRTRGVGVALTLGGLETVLYGSTDLDDPLPQKILKHADRLVAQWWGLRGS